QSGLNQSKNRRLKTGLRDNYLEKRRGARSTILKGSNIGTNSIVGTNSVVTGGKMPKNSIIAGQPARVIKNGISWNRESVIPE
ncbi:acyltransferase, partial [Aeromonas jandaei]